MTNRLEKNIVTLELERNNFNIPDNLFNKISIDDRLKELAMLVCSSKEYKILIKKRILEGIYIHETPWRQSLSTVLKAIIILVWKQIDGKLGFLDTNSINYFYMGRTQRTLESPQISMIHTYWCTVRNRWIIRYFPCGDVTRVIEKPESIYYVLEK